MINKADIHNVGKQLGFAPWQAEKDHLQHLFLRALYSNVNAELVFKGGTCLQKAYGLHRFSRDLDFNLTKRTNPLMMIEKTREMFNDLGLANTILKTEESQFSLNMLVEFDSAEMKNTLTIQISKREKLVLKPEQIAITPLYRDVPPYFAVCMNEQEILAEKIRAAYQRTFPRDVYDIWFMLRKGVKLLPSLANKKLVLINARYNKKLLLEKMQSLSKNWDELRDLVPAYPKFRVVIKEIEEAL